MPNLTHELFLPDKKRLHTLVSGQAGSGKTYLLEKLLVSSISDPTFGPGHRFILIDPKHEAFRGIKVAKAHKPMVDRVVEAIKGEVKTSTVQPSSAWSHKRFLKNRVVVIYPDLEELPFLLADIIDDLFKQSADPDFSATLVLDEAAVLIEPSRILPCIKRLATQGRSRNIRGIFVSQRPLSNRWLDGQVSDFILFDPGLPQDSELLKKRWGVNLDEHSPSLTAKRYSWLRVQFPGPTMTVMAPIGGGDE